MEAKNKLILQKCTCRPEEKMCMAQMPQSTYQLFRAIADHPLIEDLSAYNAHVQKSVHIHEELYPVPCEEKELGAPKGELRQGILEDSVFYPGIPHPYWVYLPSGYRAEEPAHLAVFYDGNKFIKDGAILHFFDNMIAQKRLPVTVAVFLSYGLDGPGQPMAGFNEGHVNRSVEYDTASDWNARFTAEEFLPLALEGLSISDRPQDHVICGMSSSGLAAFTTAWYRPDLFGNVYYASPSFADIRLGRLWPTVIRVAEKKNIRIFGMAGKYDIDNFFGNWLLGNLDVAHALQYKGYAHRFYISEAGHSMPVFHHCLPQGMEWLFMGKEPVLSNMEKVNFPVC